MHRDLKPENILLDYKDKNKFDIKVIDFGFACLFDPRDDIGLDTYLVTQSYMAPKILNYQLYTEKVDVWAIGVIIFMLLSGQMLFVGSTPKKTRLEILNSSVKLRFEQALGHVSKEAINFLSKLLDKDLNRRISCTEALCNPWIKGNADSSKENLSSS